MRRLRLLTAITLSLAGLAGGCAQRDTDAIVLVGRNSSSGTYVYFRDEVLGKREFRDGVLERNGSMDVVATVEITPSAIGYSGIGYRTDNVKVLKVSRKRGEASVLPNEQTAHSGEYPISRELYIYTLGEPTPAARQYLAWILSDTGQEVVRTKGYVPVAPKERAVQALGDATSDSSAGTARIEIGGSDTMSNLAQAWAERYHDEHPDVEISVSGGGTNNGIAGMINGTFAMINASREMYPEEIEKAEQQSGKKLHRFTVALDTLAIFVHKDNRLDEISIDELIEIYADGGSISRWSQLGGPAEKSN
jgi:ABC-type phosphate transport system substrate-binding protein